ncbi:MAG: glycosyltransferase family 4 protein [Actinomycetota bacterium]
MSRIRTFVAAEPLLASPTIVDLDDLGDLWDATKLANYKDDGRRSRGLTGLTRSLVVRRDMLAWTMIQKRVAGAVKAVCVCSEADKQHLAVPNSFVVSNGYDGPQPPAGRACVGKLPTILFQGLLTYGPNIDAARYLVERILPLLRDRVPDTQVRLVGAAAPAVRRLSSHQGVTVVGWVPRIEDELERADVIATPIRFGGGTRIKILEAFAHRIPVVSSSLGAHGLEVVHERHLLLADTPEAFADACVALITDEGKRRSLVDEAETVFLGKYQWCGIADSIRELATTVAGST